MADADNFRTRRAALNFSSGLAYTAVTLVIGFVATPFILRWLGPERYGAARATTDWFGHLGVLELGLGGSLPPLLAAAFGRGDATDLRATMVAGIRAYVAVTAAMLAAGTFLVLGVTHLVPVAPGLAQDLRTAAVVGLLGVLLMPFAPFRPLVEAEQRTYVVTVWLLAQGLLTTVCALLLAHAGYGIAGQLAALLAGQVLFQVALVASGLRRVPGLARAALRGEPHRDARTRIWRLNLPTFAFTTAGRVGLLTDNVLVALMLGPAAVAPLFLTQRLAALAGGQLLGLGTSSWAALAHLHAAGRRDDFNARLVDLTRLVGGLGVAALVPIAAFNQHFVNAWVGAASYGGTAVTVIGALNAYILALLSLWMWCFTGTGQVRALVGMSIAGAAVNLTVSVAATHWLGLVGPLVGTLVGVGTTTLWLVPRAMARTFGTPVSALLQAAAAPLAYGLPVAAIAFVVAGRHTPPGWIGLGAEMAATALVLLAIWWRWALDIAARAAFRERVRFALGRRS